MENFSGASVAYFTNSFALDRIEPNNADQNKTS